VTNAWYELAKYATENPQNPDQVGIWSNGEFFNLGQGA
jgi:hypothetical protein